MSAGSTRDAIRGVIASTLALHPDQVEGDTSFDTMQADSLDKIEVAMALEDAFAVEISDDEVAALHDVGDAIRVVERRMAETRHA